MPTVPIDNSLPTIPGTRRSNVTILLRLVRGFAKFYFVSIAGHLQLELMNI